MEGFDRLASYSELGLRSWRSIGAGLKLGTTSGRRGSVGIYNDTTGSTTQRGIEYSRNFFRTTPNLVELATTNWEIGFAFKLTGTGWDSVASGFTYPLLEIASSAPASIMYWDLNYNGTVWLIRQRYGSVTRMSGQFPGGGGAGTRPTSGQWYYVTALVSRIEGAAVASKSQFVLVDGNVIASLTSNTAQNASVTAVPVYLRLDCGNGVSGDCPSGCEVHYDDIVMCDAVGEEFTPSVSSTIGASEYMGPVRVDAYVGVAENTTYDDEFVPSSGSDEYPMLDESTQDGDTTYVASSTIGHTAQGGYIGASGSWMAHTPTTIWGAKANAVVRNAGDGICNARCDLAYLTSRPAGAAGQGLPYSLPAGGSYEGLHSLADSTSGTSGDYHGASDASSTKYVQGTLRYATALVEYVS
jgi:hypothetical protein